MGLFRNNIKKVIQEFRRINEYYSNDLGKEIKESFEDLKSEYDENSAVFTEFEEFVQEMKTKLESGDASRLESFSSRFSKVNRAARHGVEAMWELGRNQRKLSSESLMQYEEFEYKA